MPTKGKSYGKRKTPTRGKSATARTNVTKNKSKGKAAYGKKR